jgi:hypothetical protein
MAKFAWWISALFNPLIIGIPVMLAIGIADTGIRWEATPTVIASIFIMCVVPAAYIRILMKKGIFHNFHVSDRRQRVYLFPVLGGCFLLTVFLLWRDKAISRLVVAILAFGLPNVVLFGLISLRLKISLHCAGIGALLVSSVYPFGWPAAVAGFVALVVTAWSRLRLNEHTPAEVIAGSLLGTGFMAAELYAVFGLAHF